MPSPLPEDEEELHNEGGAVAFQTDGLMSKHPEEKRGYIW